MALLVLSFGGGSLMPIALPRTELVQRPGKPWCIRHPCPSCNADEDMDGINLLKPCIVQMPRRHPCMELLLVASRRRHLCIELLVMASRRRHLDTAK
jgi:hypothetical protein